MGIKRPLTFEKGGFSGFKAHKKETIEMPNLKELPQNQVKVEPIDLEALDGATILGDIPKWSNIIKPKLDV